MANLRLTFTDPATRRTVTLDAQRTREPSAASDGFVDLSLDGFDGVVRIPSSASAQDSEALPCARQPRGRRTQGRRPPSWGDSRDGEDLDLHTEATEDAATVCLGQPRRHRRSQTRLSAAGASALLASLETTHQIGAGSTLQLS